MEYVTIATTGNATDFGDLTDDSQNTSGGTGNFKCNTRFDLLVVGYVHPALVTILIFVQLQQQEMHKILVILSAARQSRTFGSCSNSTRGTFFGGQTPSYVNNIDMVTIATTGDASDFGDFDVGGQDACWSI